MSPQKRSSTRFNSDPLDCALIDFKSKNVKFNPQQTALLLNESFGGCAVIMSTMTPLEVGKKLQIKIGKMDPIPAEIMWIKNLEESIFKVGLKILD